MSISDHSKPIRVNRSCESWPDRFSREAAANKGLRRPLFGKSWVHRPRERSWQPVSPSRRIQFRYDVLNRVIDIADARQGLTRFTYDLNGNLLTVTDAKNQTTAYTYDRMDRLKTRKDALNRTETYSYDPAGNLASFTDRKGQQTTFAYDPLNRRIQATYPDATTRFTYDAVGRLMRVSDTAPGAGAIDFAYNVLDRLIQETTGQGTVSYQYDVLGRRTQMMANGLAPLTYQYDTASRLTQVAQGSLAVGLGYDAAGRRTSLTYPNGTTASYTYDNASRLTNILHQGPSGVIENLAYVYDAAGNRTSLTRNNGTASLLPSAVASATYDAANEQTSFGGQILEYDTNGNLEKEKDNGGTLLRQYAWDARNRLVGISGNAPATFNYDSLGRRISKTIGSQATQFQYDIDDIVAEISGGAVGAAYLRGLNLDEPFIRQTATGNEHYHTDSLSSTMVLSNSSSTGTTSYVYEPFGRTTSSGASSNPFQYTGRENDLASIYYYRARYYSPNLGRFMNEDRIGFSGKSLNLYSYASNSPLRFSDPLGLWSAEAHRLFLEHRFGEISDELLAQMKQGSQSVDLPAGQLPGNAPQHAMTPLSGDKKKAFREMCGFVKDQMDLFRRYLNNGSPDLAYFHLGRALHPVMDSTSPLHRGFQYWPGPGATQHGERGEGVKDITPELEEETLGLMSAVASGDYSVLKFGSMSCNK